MGNNYLLLWIHSLPFHANRRISIDYDALNDGHLRESENDQTLHWPCIQSVQISGVL